MNIAGFVAELCIAYIVVSIFKSPSSAPDLLKAPSFKPARCSLPPSVKILASSLQNMIPGPSRARILYPIFHPSVLSPLICVSADTFGALLKVLCNLLSLVFPTHSGASSAHAAKKRSDRVLSKKKVPLPKYWLTIHLNTPLNTPSLAIVAASHGAAFVAGWCVHSILLVLKALRTYAITIMAPCSMAGAVFNATWHPLVSAGLQDFLTQSRQDLPQCEVVWLFAHTANVPCPLSSTPKITASSQIDSFNARVLLRLFLVLLDCATTSPLASQRR
ncbi:hypothetical protein R3P38DRAFT_3298377 [Favolaschia claudopus]|uniref:Uncharacterized protein n=1 Tax=Favolaschia claudopus TaxID=2862362 RepID=A0AAV9Z3I3_9AGAR